jgi:hypothetical protein
MNPAKVRGFPISSLHQMVAGTMTETQVQLLANAPRPSSVYLSFRPFTPADSWEIHHEQQ